MIDQLEKLALTFQAIEEKLDKILENQEDISAQIAINSYMNLATSIIEEVQTEEGLKHGLDEAALDRMYQGLQENFYKLQEKLAGEE